MNVDTRRLVELAAGVIGLALVTAVVIRPDTAAIVTAIADSHSRMIRVMMGEKYIEIRDIPRVERLLGEIDDETMTELFAGLDDSDLDWIEQMLTGVEL